MNVLKVLLCERTTRQASFLLAGVEKGVIVRRCKVTVLLICLHVNISAPFLRISDS